MLPLLTFNESEILAFALVLLRVSSFLVSWPVFSVYSVPNPLKVLFAVTVSLLIFPVVNRSGLSTQDFGTGLAWLVGKEVLVGVCLGFVTRMFFFGIAVGGNLVATSVGLANAQIFNPTMGSQGTTIEQFYATLGTLLFLSLNGHHHFLQGLVQSFDTVPLSLSGIEIAVFKDSGLILQQVTEAGIKISAPVMVAIFFINVAMGIVGRAVPQINVLVTSMPVNFMAGLLVMIVAIPALVLELDRQLYEMAERFFEFVKAM